MTSDQFSFFIEIIEVNTIIIIIYSYSISIESNTKMNIDTLYICIIIVIAVLLIYAYVSSDYYYINMVLKNAFDELNEGDEFRTMNPDINWKIVNMEIDGYINNKKS